MSFFAYGNGTFGASFWARKHDLDLADRTWLLMAGLSLNILSALVGGWLTDKINTRRRDMKAYGWLPAIAAVAHLPLRYTTHPNLVCLPSIKSCLMTSFFQHLFPLSSASQAIS